MNPPSRKTLPTLANELDKHVIPNHIVRIFKAKIIDRGIGERERCGLKHLQRRNGCEALMQGHPRGLFQKICTIRNRSTGASTAIITTHQERIYPTTLAPSPPDSV